MGSKLLVCYKHLQQRDERQCHHLPFLWRNGHRYQSNDLQIHATKSLCTRKSVNPFILYEWIGVLLLIFYRTHTKYAVRKLGNLLNGKTVGLQWRMCSRVWNEGKTLGKTLYQTNIFKCFSELIQALLIHAQHQQNITPKSHSRLWKQNLNANNYSPKSEYCCGFFQTAACDWNCDM